ncbi:YkvA family protein [Kribbella sp. CA-293567]|uniref:YkvA family protein n=1 Tax=Kribbella sp. CA-293567 TaxID=3002436 RepID=UPI0022DD53EC|nr:YkvA family protein [Kribbella sp. CA-293567]WBQ04116.1 YkvA family protein [Kribbella sp. CA-293567]
MVIFGGLVGLVGLLTLVFRDGDVIGIPASGIGVTFLLLGAAIAGIGLLRRAKWKRKKERGEPVPVGDVFERAKALPRLLRAAKAEGYGGVSGGQKVLWGVALVYLISPIDVLPDLLPLIGIADDAGVGVWLFTSVSTAAGLYLRHERERRGLPPR